MSSVVVKWNKHVQWHLREEFRGDAEIVPEAPWVLSIQLLQEVVVVAVWASCSMRQ